MRKYRASSSHFCQRNGECVLWEGDLGVVSFWKQGQGGILPAFGWERGAWHSLILRTWERVSFLSRWYYLPYTEERPLRRPVLQAERSLRICSGLSSILPFPCWRCPSMKWSNHNVPFSCGRAALRTPNTITETPRRPLGERSLDRVTPALEQRWILISFE